VRSKRGGMRASRHGLRRPLVVAAAAASVVALAGCAGPQEVALGDSATIEARIDDADLTLEIAVLSVTPADEALEGMSSTGSLPDHLWFVEYEMTVTGTPSEDTLEVIDSRRVEGNRSIEGMSIIGSVEGCDELWGEDVVEGQAQQGCLVVAGNEDAIEYVQIHGVRWML
jgi:hypothetical protein